MKSKFIPIIFFPLFLGSCGSKEYPNSNFEVVATGKTKEYLVETAGTKIIERGQNTRFWSYNSTERDEYNGRIVRGEQGSYPYDYSKLKYYIANANGINHKTKSQSDLSLIHQSYLQNGGERFYLSFDSDLSNYCEWHSNDINDPDYGIVELEV